MIVTRHPCLKALRSGGAVLCAFVVACGIVETSGDSESHFLATCEATCEPGFECICGVCTRPCNGAAECRTLADDASCRALDTDQCKTETSHAFSCDLSCISDAQCRSLSSSHRCVDGQCRLGAIPRGTAGASGTSGTHGGSSGAGTSGGASGTAGASGNDCCLSEPIAWSLDGGLLQPSNQTLTGCVFEKTMGEASCTSQLPACNDDWELDAEALETVLAHADVRTAVLEAPVFYGMDTRPGDNTVLIVEIEGVEISVGLDCTEASCPPIPEGIRALRQTLETLDIQQSARGSCAPSAACYLPIVSGPCQAAFTRYAYDSGLRSCVEFAYGGCEGNDNNFESGPECRAACQNDPCRTGSPFDPSNPEECGVLANERCFADGLLACLCACALSGATLDQCEILEPIPAFAACGQ